jgi:hypothetical protein
VDIPRNAQIAHVAGDEIGRRPRLVVFPCPLGRLTDNINKRFGGALAIVESVRRVGEATASVARFEDCRVVPQQDPNPSCGKMDMLDHAAGRDPDNFHLNWTIVPYTQDPCAIIDRLLYRHARTPPRAAASLACAHISAKIATDPRNSAVSSMFAAAAAERGDAS